MVFSVLLLPVEAAVVVLLLLLKALAKTLDVTSPSSIQYTRLHVQHSYFLIHFDLNDGTQLVANYISLHCMTNQFVHKIFAIKLMVVTCYCFS